MTFVFCLTALFFGGGIWSKSSCFVPSCFGVVLELTGCFSAALFSKSSRLFVEFLTVSFRSLNTREIHSNQVSTVHSLDFRFNMHIQRLADFICIAHFFENYYC